MRYSTAYADWSVREYAAIARCMSQGQVHRGPQPAKLAERLSELYAPSAVHLLNYGHHAIRIALDMFKQERPERGEVIVPAYICPSVPQAVAACGLTVRSVPVQDDLNMDPAHVQAAMNANTLAVIAPHMYGSPARIGEIETACVAAQVFLIDDAAQVAGIRQDGRLLGTFGDTGVISFAQSKTIVTGIGGSGGVLLVNRPQWKQAASQRCAALPPAQGRLGSVGDFLWNYIGSAYTGHSGYYLSRLRARLGIKQVHTDSATQISNLDASVALAQLHRLDALVQEKFRVARGYHEALQAYPLLGFPQYSPHRFLARVMLLLPVGVDIGRVRAASRLQGVATRLGYAPQLANEAAPGQADLLVQRLVGVPCGPGMGQRDIERVCAILNATLQSTA